MATSTVLKKLSIAAAGAVCLSLGTMGSAHAASLSSGTWTSFSFGEAGSSSNPATFDFTSPEGGDTLKVTDAFLSGDVFSVFDFGKLLGSTSFGSIGSSIPDPDLAFASPAFSHGIFQLASGLHSISIVADVSPYGGGGAYIRRDAASVPTPALLPGLVGLGMAALRKRKGEAIEEKAEV